MDCTGGPSGNRRRLAVRAGGAWRYRRTMTVSIGGREFASCTGRAVSIRYGDPGPDLGNVLREAGRVGATILIASPGCLSSREPAIAVAAGHGFEVVISVPVGDAIRNSLINAAILPVSLSPA